MRDIPRNLRLTDLLAKTAKVSIKDTLRVLYAIETINEFYGISSELLDGDYERDTARATPENVAVCEAEYFALENSNDLFIAANLAIIKKLK